MKHWNIVWNFSRYGSELTELELANLQVPFPRSNSGKRKFAYSAATFFNSLDTDLERMASVSLSSTIFSSRLNNFKHRLRLLFL